MIVTGGYGRPRTGAIAAGGYGRATTTNVVVRVEIGSFGLGRRYGAEALDR